MRGRIDGLGVKQGLGTGMPLSPTLNRSIDFQVRCSKQAAEEPLVPPPCGVQQCDALRQSDTSLKFFGILRRSLGKQIAPQFPSAMPLNVLPPCVLILCILMGCDAKWILYLGAYLTETGVPRNRKTANAAVLPKSDQVF